MLTVTAQTLQDAVQTLQAAQSALGQLNTAAQSIKTAAASTAGLSPMEIALAVGPIISHISKDVTKYIPDSLRGPASILSMIGATTIGAISQGTPWQQAVGYGFVTALTGTAWYHAVAKDGSVLDMLQGAVDAMKQPTVSPITIHQVLPQTMAPAVITEPAAQPVPAAAVAVPPKPVAASTVIPPSLG